MAESSVFPELTSDYILAFQFSSWYPTFAKSSVRSTFIRPIPADFLDYLNSDGVFVPHGSEDGSTESTIEDDDEDTADDDDDDTDSEDTRRKDFAFPDLDKQIRDCIREYDAVFPKLNFSSPKDAAWLLPSSSPLKCTSPADVYLLLKSSDFITHDLDSSNVFEGCNEPYSSDSQYTLELVLRKWYPMERNREVRCFVRDGLLIGISQRDSNYYDFWNDETVKAKATSTIQQFWETEIKPKWANGHDYVFDLLLTRDLLRAHILDFGPYSTKTEPLLFTYEELHGIRQSQIILPVLRVVDSASHSAATRNAPAYQHNMVPFEAISLSNGRDIDDFAALWKDSVQRAV